MLTIVRQTYTRTKVNEEVYKSLAKCLRTAGTRHGGAFRHLAGDEILQLEFAPMINRIISPPLRPVRTFSATRCSALPRTWDIDMIDLMLISISLLRLTNKSSSRMNVRF